MPLRAPRHTPMLNCPKVDGLQNSVIAILFSIVEKPSNYIFGDDLVPHNPRVIGYKCTDALTRGCFGMSRGVIKGSVQKF